MRAARLGAPARGVLDLATPNAADGRGLGVTADFFREARFFMGDSPLTPRESRMSASAFPSDGTKMLQWLTLISEADMEERVGRNKNAPSTIAKARFEAFLALRFALLHCPCKRSRWHVLVRIQYKY